MTLTSLLARALDRFLFPDALVEAGACVHQLPVHRISGTPECVDFCVLKLEAALPDRPIGIADYKRDNIDETVKESFGYSARLIQNSSAKWEFAARLVFLWTRERIKLQLHVGLKSHIMVINIVSVPIDNDTQLRKFFCTLYTAVQYLLTHQVTNLTTPCISPRPTLSFEHCLSPDQPTAPARVNLTAAFWSYRATCVN